MEDKRLKTLQLMYAGVLADAVANYCEFSILEEVTTKKQKEQLASAPMQLAQLGIKEPEALFDTFSSIFGCADWEVEKTDEGYKADCSSCLLAAVSRKRGTEAPCRMFCINPFSAYSEALGYSMEVEKTLWDNDGCSFILSRKA